jgi:hypothetical protein
VHSENRFCKPAKCCLLSTVALLLLLLLLDFYLCIKDMLDVGEADSM